MEQVLLVVTGVGVLGSLAVSIVAFLATRHKDEGTLAAEERINEFTIMQGTIQILRQSLDDAQEKAEALQGTVNDLRVEVKMLNDELTASLANVAIQNSFIEENVPQEITRPRLRKVIKS